MGYFTRNEKTAKDQIVNLYSGASPEQIAGAIDKIFTSSSYKLISDRNGVKTYERGNRIMRILFGAFVKYFKFTVTIQPAGDDVRMTMRKATSGFSGGLIGVGQVKKEMKRLGEAFTKF